MDNHNMNHQTSTRMSLRLDYRIITLLLLAVIAAMLFIWKPWQDTISTSSRTIQVTGEASLAATPDEFVFYPAYDFKNSDKAAALAELSAKSDAIVATLKELGIANKNIKTDSSGYDFPAYGEDTGTPTYTLRLTVTVADRELAQEVQNYLLTTTPTEGVSPQATFSDKKRKELESKARDQATKEARVKAEQSANNLDFSLGAIKTIEDGTGFGNLPYQNRGAAADSMAAAETTQLSIQPGENELTYSVTVTYFVK